MSLLVVSSLLSQNIDPWHVVVAYVVDIIIVVQPSLPPVPAPCPSACSSEYLCSHSPYLLVHSLVCLPSQSTYNEDRMVIRHISHMLHNMHLNIYYFILTILTPKPSMTMWTKLAICLEVVSAKHCSKQTSNSTARQRFNDIVPKVT